MLFVPRDTGHTLIDLGIALLGLELVVYWLCESQNSLQPFSRWITVPRLARLEAKCKRSKVKFSLEFNDIT